MVMWPSCFWCLNNRTLRVKLGDHRSSVGCSKKRGAPGLCAWTPSLPDIYQWLSRWTEMQSFVLRRRRQAHRPKKSATRAFNWSHRWDLPLNASKSHHLSIGGTPDLRIALPEEAAGKSLQKCELINDLGITVNAAFTPSANILADANVVLHKKIFYLFDKGDFCTSIQYFGATSSRIRHAS